MGSESLTVAVIGCGRLGQHYAAVYAARPDTTLIAIAEANPERRRVVGERFGVTRLFADARSLFAEVVPDVAALVLPVRYIKDAVLAAVAAGVRGVTTDKPIAATLADADAMVEACRDAGVVFGGGNLQRARADVQEAAAWLHAGEFGPVTGAVVHRWGGEISGGGCQHISVLRLLTGAEVAEVVAWGTPEHKLTDGEDEEGLIINGRFTMSDGLAVPVFGTETPQKGVDVWTERALIRWDWEATTVYAGRDAAGRRLPLDRPFTPAAYPRFGYLGTSIGSFLDAVRTGSELWISGHDLRQALEVAIAAKQSAACGSVPVALPLADRTLTLRPRPYRWLGGDASGREQSAAEAATPWTGYD
ncbi:MAG: Gfo/Idh/MocA family oxidoreductase [Spirochaetaceae bacterium]|nr:Gfo/Idh/MocA family oxidoreductase [Spirochaetaceae bacterium]